MDGVSSDPDRARRRAADEDTKLITTRSPLFVFGTLVDADVRTAVLGPVPTPRTEAAVLPEHVALAVAGRDYPVAVPAPGRRAPGLLLHGLDADAHARLAWFEGDAYALAPCRVEAGDALVDAAMFLAARSLPVDGPWSLDDWRRDAKPAFLARARAWMAELGAAAPLADGVVWGHGPGNDDPVPD